MLTIVIPSYNHEKYIVDCLDAISRLDVNGLRVIVIDDGSTDNTPDTVRAYIESQHSSGIELICKKNSGLVSSLNMGLQSVNTEFVYFVASDDVPRPEGLRKCLELLVANPSLRFCIGGGDNFFDDVISDETLTPVYRAQHQDFFFAEPTQRAEKIFLDYPAPLLLQSVVFRTSALRDIGGWDPRLLWDDYPTFVKLLSRFPQLDVDFIYRPEVKVIYYRHHGNNSYKNLPKQFLMVQQTMKMLAPEKLKAKAVGNAIAFYSLIALRSADVRATVRILKLAAWRDMIFAIPAGFRLILRKATSGK